MALNFRAVSSDEVLVDVSNNGRGRQASISEFANCELDGLGYVLTEGIDYLPDSSDAESDIPKLSSVRQRLMNYAKKWSESRKSADPANNQDVLVKTKTQLVKTENEGKEMKIPVLRFWFKLGERKVRAKRTSAVVVNNTQQTEQVEVQS